MRDRQKPAFVLALAVLLSWVWSGGALRAADSSFTLEQILSFPFSSSMAASPDGRKVAWVTVQNGARNIWVAEGPGFEGRNLTGWTADDGQELSPPVWGPGGDRLYFARGGGPNSQGEFPNPGLDPAGAELAVWTVDLTGAPPKRLFEGYSPSPSPRGDGLAFLSKGQIWWHKTGAEEEPAQLLHTRGSCSQLTWSPDGSRLAFRSGRSTHDFIGVYDLAKQRLRYLDPSVDSDYGPAWSPDGKKIAFVRTATEDHLIFTPQREADPWSIRVVDVGTGEGRQVWKADPGRGSAFRELAAESQIFWTKNGLLVFPWEKDGWTHLYAVSENGGQARLLTPGEFEVEEAVLSRDGATLVITSNQDDIDGRHLWEVRTGGSTDSPAPVIRLTTDNGIQWSGTPLADGLAFIASNARSPAQPYIRSGGSTRLLAEGTLPSDFPEEQLVEPEVVVFPASDGLSIHGQLFRPAGTSEKRPAILFFHGGSRRQMLPGWHYLDYYHHCYALNQYLASRGFLVLSVNYRSGIGYGMEFREAIGYGAAGAAEFNDVTGAALYLRGRPDVDPKRIGLWGGSYGGYLTALGLARASNLFAAGVDIHGVHNWNPVITNFVPSYDPLEHPEQARLAFDSSPMASVQTWHSPVLLIHGDDDRNVPFSESVDLARALRARGVEFEELVFPDEIHDFLLHRNWLAAYRAAADFFERRLGR